MSQDQGTPLPPAAGPARQGVAVASPAASPPRMSRARRVRYAIVACILLAAAAVTGTWYYLYARAHEWTDDAFIAGHLVQISPRVPGRVLKVRFTDNQAVKAGQVLVEIDPRDFQVRLDQARAGLASAQDQEKTAETNILLVIRLSMASLAEAWAGVEQAQWGVDMAQANLAAARATADRAKAATDAADADAVRTAADLKRAKQLFDEKRISPREMDAATAAAQAAAAQLEAARQAHAAATAGADLAQAQLAQAGAKLLEQNAKLDTSRAYPQRFDVATSQYETARSEVRRLASLVAQAELELSYTQIVAPQDGRLARKTVEEGNMVQAGQGLAALVPPDVWVIANFKETALGRLKVGQHVSISADAYPGKVFRGHVDSLQAGSGAVFSLLPPENATGNYVKIVQRVPVKIVFDEPPEEPYWLAPGMSVEPEVDLE